MKNILILNAGTRDTLVRYFKDTCGQERRVVVTDSYELAPALYEGDRHYITKRWDKKGYWDDIERICGDEDIGLLFSLIDPELGSLAAQRKRFEEKGILVNIGEERTVRAAFDKYKTLEFLKENGYPWIRSYISFDLARGAVEKGDISFPLVVKPRKGSGSSGIEVVDSIERLQYICQNAPDVLIQEYMRGQEIGADIFVDLLRGEVVSIFTKKKLKMRAGETDKSVSFKDERLFRLLADFAGRFGLKGVNDIDVFERDGEYYISEVNPRFGGGYLHAYASGVDFPRYLINNMDGIVNETAIGAYDSGIYMMKYFAIKVMHEDEIMDKRPDSRTEHLERYR